MWRRVARSLTPSRRASSPAVTPDRLCSTSSVRRARAVGLSGRGDLADLGDSGGTENTVARSTAYRKRFVGNTSYGEVEHDDNHNSQET